MNNQLIEKIITSNNEPCPEFTFENPLLDKNVAKALSKSFIKILNTTEPNSKVKNNLRLSILEKLRKMCQIEPENHMKIDENVTSMLVEAYEQKDSSTDNDGTGKILDEFLVRNMKDMNINSSHSTSISPEVLQALINLNGNRGNLNTLYKDIIHWDSMDKKNMHILKDLWLNVSMQS
ncbi:unnamed protein product [Arctia plantaginis]|uniref:Uncharacterized protein n=1 Tax=Arctia plantaginis TaxID=874455 RepID=A0A8S0Z756_ARCPL|nr:unnamed protein product [Arctia plantaginis]CAB3258399.1 unnamed protein product [Arctia plantaginis]